MSGLSCATEQNRHWLRWTEPIQICPIGWMDEWMNGGWTGSCNQGTWICYPLSKIGNFETCSSSRKAWWRSWTGSPCHLHTCVWWIMWGRRDHIQETVSCGTDGWMGYHKQTQYFTKEKDVRRHSFMKKRHQLLCIVRVCESFDIQCVSGLKKTQVSFDCANVL